jgi:WhiB family redox-sensing transcriptional regulator
MTSALNNTHHAGQSQPEGVPVHEVVGECTKDPDRWIASTSEADAEAAKAICRGCARRWLCARSAVETSGAEGIWAGIEIPETGRGRTFALKQLTSLAERGGYLVRKRARRPQPEDE